MRALPIFVLLTDQELIAQVNASANIGGNAQFWLSTGMRACGIWLPVRVKLDTMEHGAF
jgi:hypothetical protein